MELVQAVHPVGQVMHCIDVALGYVPAGQLVGSTQVLVTVLRYPVEHDRQAEAVAQVAHGATQVKQYIED